MGPAYEVEVVLVQELGDNLGSECEGDAPVILTPAHRVLYRIALLIPSTTTVLANVTDRIDQGFGSVFIFTDPDPDPEDLDGGQYGSGPGSNPDPGL